MSHKALTRGELIPWSDATVASATLGSHNLAIRVGHEDLEWRELDHSLKMALQTQHGTASSRVLNGYSTLATDGILRAA